MCIRDRACTRGRDQGSAIAGSIGCVGQLGIVVGVAHFIACLLYTSDAADERSSVDLGGRRIIKKKQNIQHRTSATHLATHIDKCNTMSNKPKRH